MTKLTELSRCRGCWGPRETLSEIFAMDPMPLAGEFSLTKSEAESAPLFPLTWLRCSMCSLVQVAEDIDDGALFGAYNYASSSVPVLVAHFESYAEELKRLYGQNVALLEIGCNDGVLLRRLPTDWTLVGVDPSDVTARASVGAAYDIVNKPFSAELAEALACDRLYDVVTGSNCLAHISDLRDVFSGVARVLKIGGDFILEVHNLETILSGNQWDTIYHEHKAEWSVGALQRCLTPLGFQFIRVDRLPLHGGLLRAVFRRASDTTDGRVPCDESFRFDGLREAYASRRESATYAQISAANSSGRSVSAYGAAGRANVWLNQHPELRFEYIIDDAPLRRGKWMPRVAVPIIGSDAILSRPTDLCVITAWTYAEPIKRKHPDYTGIWTQTLRV